MARPTLYTVGHSTRSFDDFVALLKRHGVQAVADVRRFPGSRKYPHFNEGNLAQSLPAAGLQYVPFPSLGGRRRTSAGSANTGWRNDGFRGYADYMDTPAFEDGLRQLVVLAGAAPTVIMCAEAVPWRCHRNLISDAVVALGTAVDHIIDAGAPQSHVLNPGARVRPDGTLTYPAPGSEQVGLDL